MAELARQLRVCISVPGVRSCNITFADLGWRYRKIIRLEFPGAVYPVTSRGNASQAIFLDKDDRESFLGVLSSVVARFNWLCHACCLLETHYPLMVGNLPKAPPKRGQLGLFGKEAEP